ncbi:hypothetical protein [Paenibacillus elgii]|uniref:hypothetical protein n=1 Tax=Paenibacillus elgii TaxID=189691 RepID=UPI000248C5F4|nr:hypothetical protein [Paenibacillus elgii]
MSGKKRIENDEQYQKSLDWLITTAAKLADPLCDMTEQEKVKTQAIYDRTAQLVRSYRLGEMAREFPGLREVYKGLGWEFDEPSPPKQPETPVQQPKFDPAPQTQQASLWLDDDD